MKKLKIISDWSKAYYYMYVSIAEIAQQNGSRLLGKQIFANISERVRNFRDRKKLFKIFENHQSLR